MLRIASSAGVSELNVVLSLYHVSLAASQGNKSLGLARRRGRSGAHAGSLAKRVWFKLPHGSKPARSPRAAPACEAERLARRLNVIYIDFYGVHG